MLMCTTVVEGRIFNWEDILSCFLRDNIEQAHNPKEGQQYKIFFTSYILDIVCANMTFPTMNWRWIIQEELVDIYYKILWEDPYIQEYAHICQYFPMPLYEAIPRMYEMARHVVLLFHDWFMDQDGTYLIIFGETKTLHL